MKTLTAAMLFSLTKSGFEVSVPRLLSPRLLFRLLLNWDYQLHMFRIALANIRFPATPDESVTLAEQAIAQASLERAGLICFPECFVPGYRGLGYAPPPPDPAFQIGRAHV